MFIWQVWCMHHKYEVAQMLKFYDELRNHANISNSKKLFYYNKDIC